MEKFLIRREIKGVSSLSRHDIGEWGKASENILEKMRKEGKKIKQEATYVAGDSMFCVYEAENENLIKEHGERFQPSFIAEIMEISAILGKNNLL